MEEMAIDQVRTLDLEREKRLDATRTFKNFEVDLLKVREDLKEVTRARDSAKSGLANAQKQAEDQTRRLQEAEGQLQITKEQIFDLKQKLAAVKEGKKVVEWAKDEALRAKERLCLPGHRPSTPRRRPRRRPMTWEWLRPKLL